MTSLELQTNLLSAHKRKNSRERYPASASSFTWISVVLEHDLHKWTISSVRKLPVCTKGMARGLKYHLVKALMYAHLSRRTRVDDGDGNLRDVAVNVTANIANCCKG